MCSVKNVRIYFISCLTKCLENIFFLFTDKMFTSSSHGLETVDLLDMKNECERAVDILPTNLNSLPNPLSNNMIIDLENENYESEPISIDEPWMNMSFKKSKSKIDFIDNNSEKSSENCLVEHVSDQYFSSELVVDSQIHQKEHNTKNHKVEINKEFLESFENLKDESKLDLLDNEDQFLLDNYGRNLYEKLSPLKSESNLPYPDLNQFSFGENVEITHVKDPNIFYIQRINCRRELKHLSEKINYFVQSCEPIVDPKINNLYLAKFTTDNKWYRVIVKKIKPEQEKVRVHYIDFGNSEYNTYSNLRKCPLKFTIEKYPVFGLPCSLYDLKPAFGDKWDLESIFVFTELVENSVLQLNMIKISSRDDTEAKYEVDLWRPPKIGGFSDDLPMSIREVLIFMENATYINETEEDINNKSVTSRFRTFICPEIEFGVDFINIDVAHFISPDEFYVQLKSSAINLTEIMETIQFRYQARDMKTDKEWKIYLPKIGMVCVAKGKSNFEWGRAIIKDLLGRKKVLVLFVDYGHTESLSVKYLRKIPDDLMRFPAQAIRCRLKDIVTKSNEVEWPLMTVEEAKRFIKESENNLMVTFHDYDGGISSVSLYVNSVDVDLGCFLINKGLAKSSQCQRNSKQNQGLDLYLDKFYYESQYCTKAKGIRSIRPGRRQYRSNKGDEEEEGEKDAVNQRSVNECHLNVEFLGMNSPDAIHLRFISKKIPYMKFIEILNDEIMKHKSSSYSSYKPVIGDVCCMYSKSSMSYERVKILTHESHETYQVYFFDSGKFDTAEKSSLLSMPPKLLNQNGFSLIVSLSGVSPPCGKKEWPKTTIDFLEEQLSTRNNWSICRKGKAYKNLDFHGIKILPAELYWTAEVSGGPFEANVNKRYSLNDTLIEMGLALPDRYMSNSDSEFSDAEYDDIDFKNFSTLSLCPEETDEQIERSLDDSKESSEIKPFEDDIFNRPLKKWKPANPLKKEDYVGVPTNVDADGNICFYLIEGMLLKYII